MVWLSRCVRAKFLVALVDRARVDKPRLLRQLTRAAYAKVVEEYDL